MTFFRGTPLYCDMGQAAPIANEYFDRSITVCVCRRSEFCRMTLRRLHPLTAALGYILENYDEFERLLSAKKAVLTSATGLLL